MLAEMRIQGLGVIDDATLELDPGLTVLTGETGAGKTMVVTGLTLLGGGRAEASRVADGAAPGRGRGPVHARTPRRWRSPTRSGAEADDDGTLIAVRTVGADGRSRAHLGGRAVPVGVLARLAEAALAVHGQNDQLRLLRPAEQRALLDRFAGEAVAAPLAGTGRCGRSGRRSPPSWPSGATARGGSRRRPTCCGTGWPRSPRSTRSRARTRELAEQARRLAAADDLREAAATAAPRWPAAERRRRAGRRRGALGPGRRGPPPARRVRRPRAGGARPGARRRPGAARRRRRAS